MPDLALPPATWTISYWATTIQGGYREYHEDALVVGGTAAFGSGSVLGGTHWLDDNDWLLLSVIDGMGGHGGGGDAAAMAASDLARLSSPPRQWPATLEAISDRVAAAGESLGTPRMGATMAAIVVMKDVVTSVNLGDCRVYQAATGRVEMLSVDDHDPDSPSGVVTQRLGGAPRKLEPHEIEVTHDPRGRARYLLCSDGLHGAIPPGLIRRLLLKDSDPMSITEELVLAAHEFDTTDNYSLIVADVEPVR